MANLPVDCLPAPHCEEMGAAQPQVTLTTPANDCCRLTSAPVPEKTQTAPAPAVQIVPVPSHDATPLASPGLPVAVSSPVARSAPPDLQSVLCVFLI